jgi:hypothetical protein
MLGLLGLISAQLVGGRVAVARADAPVAGAGSAISTASVLGAVPIVGNTNLAVSVGDSEASYQSDEARSSSQTLNLGGLGVILANTPFCGTIALPSNKQPQPLTDDTVGGTPSSSNNLPGAGTEAVTAVPTPESASSTTTPVGQVIPGLLTVVGQSTTSVAYLSSGEREASSSVQLALNIGNGLVELNGLTWVASQRSGTTPLSQGTFSAGSIKVGPTVIPAPSTAQLAGAVALANTLLHTLGLALILPKVSVDSATATVTVTPLEITVGKSALSDAVISPLIKQVSALETELNGQTVPGNECTNAKVLLANLANPSETVANVALGVFSNGGGFDLDVGGVTADTLAPPDFSDPFGSLSLPALGSVLPPLGGSLGALPPADSALPPTNPAASTSSTTIPPQSTSAGTGALSSATHCTTTSPSGHPGCWSGDAEVVGAVAVVAGGALFLADLRKSRRSRRKTLEEAPT